MSATSKGTVLITGASSGIGAVYADRLAHRGYDLILVARSEDKLKALADRIGKATGRHVGILAADLNARDGLAAVEAVLKSDKSITGLVNNAGFGSATPLLQASAEKMEDMIGLNVTALTRLTYAAVPGLVERGGGTIVNIASIVAIAPELLNGVYGGSKAYVLAFSQSLHHELADKNIRIQAVLPGATATDFWNVLGVPVEQLPESIGVMSAEDMVDAALAGLDQGEVVTIPALPELADWAGFEAARKRLSPNLSHPKPAARYRVGQASAA
ncbi:SDR family oxidoreductase [Labrys okinawensis]|uniref:NADP-dependent 3-hydroxy acid dehydrogenase YdfG n=1 Tax=Labrys okinawensis TaxID=346911 RepID=A0A2S9Q469_9HYPH|nr:SDR family oxidoreductase [Labrys okinawensis]PRH84141.1 SDR family oxidoreductase [Labrys okinawensis]